MPDVQTIDQARDDAFNRFEQRDLDGTALLCRDILKQDPNDVEMMNLLSLVLQDRGELDEAVELLSRAIELDPTFVEAIANMARAMNLALKWDSAKALSQRAIELDPELGEAWRQLGYASLHKNDNDDALASFQEALNYFPEAMELLAGAATAAMKLKDHKTAEGLWRRVLAQDPDHVVGLTNLGISVGEQGGQGALDEALRFHRRAVELAPTNPEALEALAVTYHKRQEGAHLRDASRALLAQRPGFTTGMMLLSSGLTWMGDFDAACATLEKVLALEPEHSEARWMLISLRSGAVSSEEIAALRMYKDDETAKFTNRVASGFALGAALDRAGDPDAAFEAYAAANLSVVKDLEEKGERFDRPRFHQFIDRCRAWFTPDLFDRLRSRGNNSETPVFIVGMPRSGTTLVEQIASSHSQVHGAGELDEVFRIFRRLTREKPLGMPPDEWPEDELREEAEQHLNFLKKLGGDAVRIIDKLPDNVQFMGHIRVMFPNARFIVCRRDFRDICVSCYMQNFAQSINWAYDLEDLGIRAAGIDDLMTHWRAVVPGPVLEVTYETLVGDLEAESRRIIDFLGLKWEPACLEFHKNERQVVTASYQQVRQPIYNSSVARWRRYESHLGPLLKCLEGHVSDEPAGTP